MITDILRKFINNIPNFHKLDISEENIIECTVPSVEEVENLPISILESDDAWWLRSPGNLDNFVGVVEYDNNVYNNGSLIHHRQGVRPLLITSLISDNLQLYEIYKIFGTYWYYIGEGKFLTEDIQFESIFDSNSNDYEKSVLKIRLEEWFNKKLSQYESQLNFEESLREEYGDFRKVISKMQKDGFAYNGTNDDDSISFRKGSEEKTFDSLEQAVEETRVNESFDYDEYTKDKSFWQGKLPKEVYERLADGKVRSSDLPVLTGAYYLFSKEGRHSGKTKEECLDYMLEWASGDNPRLDWTPLVYKRWLTSTPNTEEEYFKKVNYDKGYTKEIYK